ncbi:major facilitator superfamily domain-containing protein [Endogone sp. FLAS-F59071]|nr:major facilitator superfamily domain-containing protein [Endogone sp. FLAS-F59071]|eukprot:RUS15888.1 major facilitator superfamily domain-containing protein [Endogone sp. FLAS-F59071]
MDEILPADVMINRSGAIRASSKTSSPHLQHPVTYNDAPETRPVLVESSTQLRPPSVTRHTGGDLDPRQPPSPAGSGVSYNPRDSNTWRSSSLAGRSHFRSPPPSGDLRLSTQFPEEGSSMQPWNDRRNSSMEVGGDGERITRSSVEIPIMAQGQIINDKVPKAKQVPLMIGFVITSFLAGLDASSYPLALPSIHNTYPNTDTLWLKVAYMLAFYSACPLYGYYSNIFGRRPLLCGSLTIYAIGSLVGGFAVNAAMLIACRTFAGLGAAGLLSMILVVLGDIFPVQKRPVYLLFVFTSFVLGEIAGRMITCVVITYMDWRPLFWISAILAFITFSLIFPFSKLIDHDHAERPPTSERLRAVDFLGTATLVGAIVTFLLATTLAASGTFQWSSVAVVGLYHAAAISVALLLLIEKTATKPLVPLQIVEERSLVAILVMSMTIGFGWNGFFEHVPFFMQVLHSENTIMSGIRFIPLFVANVVCSILAVTTVRRLDFRFYLVSGLALFAIGIGLTSILDQSTGFGQEIAFYLEFGAGTGFFLPILVTAGQAFSRGEEMAIVTNLIVFFISLSGAISDAMWDQILTTDFPSRLDQISTDILSATSKQLALTSITSIGTLPATAQSAIVSAFTESVQLALRITVPFAVVAFLAAFWVESFHMVGRAQMYINQRAAQSTV